MPNAELRSHFVAKKRRQRHNLCVTLDRRLPRTDTAEDQIALGYLRGIPTVLCRVLQNDAACTGRSVSESGDHTFSSTANSIGKHSFGLAFVTSSFANIGVETTENKPLKLQIIDL